MPTIKLVVIGASGVGKTSLRSQYISGRFSNGYRATIGADFITKTLPHPTNPAETVTLQIWDTAGQERFSSLSTAFFRGADAALLMFDVNSAETMKTLTKWWAEFRQSAPLKDEDMQDFCCVVVGNKTDLVGSPSRTNDIAMGGERDGPVSREVALKFLNELVPPASRSPSPIYLEEAEEALSQYHATARPRHSIKIPPPRVQTPSPKTPSPDPIDIPSDSNGKPSQLLTNGSAQVSSAISPSNSLKPRLSKSRSRSSHGFYMGIAATTATSTLSIYHTPSSSFFDQYHSARSTPDLPSSSSSSAAFGQLNHRPSSSSLTSLESSTDDPFLSLPASVNGSVRNRRLTDVSVASGSSGSAPTITPSLFARESELAAHHSETVATTPAHERPLPLPSSENEARPTGVLVVLPPPPDAGPKLFFTSAKTGEGVQEVFEYIAKRVVRRWEFEERREARRMYIRERDATANETIRLGAGGARRGGRWERGSNGDARGGSAGAGSGGEWMWMGRAGRSDCCSS